MADSGPSLLISLLDVGDLADLNKPGISGDALTYRGLNPRLKKEVQKKLYEALYAITEYSGVHRDLSMGMAKALARVLKDNISGLSVIDGNDPQVKILRDELTRIVKEAIDDAKNDAF